jgi:opacity protein-like surface antigen
VLLVASSLVSYSQSNISVQPWEGEFLVGGTYPLGSFNHGKKNAGAELGLEVRHNFANSNWDCGLLLDVTTAVYKFASTYSGESLYQSNRTVGALLVGDYNFRQGSVLNPYVGVGLGVGPYDVVYDKVYSEKGTHFLCRPQVGVEIYRHVRVNLHAMIGKPGFCNVGASIGVVVGGRPKKH